MGKIELNNIITLDFETYYSTEYSMSKPTYNTSAYIRDPQFHVHCCAVKLGKKKSKCYPGKELKTVFADIDWKNSALLAHNTAFDGFILAERYGIVPAFYYDTLSMTRALHGELSRASLDTIVKLYQLGAKHEGALESTKNKRELSSDELKRLMHYCNNDNELCWNVFLKQIVVFPEAELELIDLVVRMFCNSPLQVDLGMARKALAEEMIARRSEILKSGATEEELQSNAKFAQRLRELKVEPPEKISLKTGHINYALAQTDPEFLELLEHENSHVVRLARGRLAAKSQQAETRASRLIQAGETGCLPVGYNYSAAKTHRFGGTNKLNLQNLPRVNKKEPKPSDGLRRSIVAPPGHVLVVVDSAQIEARTNAWLHDQTDLVNLFAAGEDVYSHMAADIYGVSRTKVTKEQRFVGKVATLGLGYSMGATKFQTTLALGIMGPPVELDALTCQRIVNLYRGRNRRITMGWDYCRNILGRMARGQAGRMYNGLLEFEPNTIWLPNGLPMRYPGLTQTENGEFRFKSHGVWKKIYGGLLVENIVQALARCIVMEQILDWHHWNKALKLRKNELAKICMTTHDEGVNCVPERLAEKALTEGLMLFRTAPSWAEGLPLDAEGSYDRRYSK